MIKKVILSVLLVVMVFVGYKGYKYYAETYKSEVAYAKVSDKIPEIKDAKYQDGSVVAGSKTYSYDFYFVKEDGSVQKMEYDLTGESDQLKPLTPGSYVKAEISKKRVTKGPNEISETKIPKNVLNKLHK